MRVGASNEEPHSMVQPSIARISLQEARFFLDQAVETSRNRDAFVYNLEAAIVFARSVTLLIQKE